MSLPAAGQPVSLPADQQRANHPSLSGAPRIFGRERTRLEQPRKAPPCCDPGKRKLTA